MKAIIINHLIGGIFLLLPFLSPAQNQLSLGTGAGVRQALNYNPVGNKKMGFSIMPLKIGFVFAENDDTIHPFLNVQSRVGNNIIEVDSADEIIKLHVVSLSALAGGTMRSDLLRVELAAGVITRNAKFNHSNEPYIREFINSTGFTTYSYIAYNITEKTSLGLSTSYEATPLFKEYPTVTDFGALSTNDASLNNLSFEITIQKNIF